jgi:hypothetical protein
MEYLLCGNQQKNCVISRYLETSFQLFSIESFKQNTLKPEILEPEIHKPVFWD